MSKIAIMLADGFEEIEGLTVVDVCRRAGLEIDMVSNTDAMEIVTARQIIVRADKSFSETDLDKYDCIVLPGGGQGYKNLESNKALLSKVDAFVREGRTVAAICAAPTILGRMGVLKGRNATCYPGMEDQLLGAEVGYNAVEVNGSIITSRGMGTSIDFALKIVETFCGKDTADRIAQQIVYGRND